MTKKILVYITLLLIIIVFIAYIIRHFEGKLPLPIKTEQVIVQNLYHTINTAGIIAIKDVFKIGSLVPGTVKKIHVTENQQVKKGDLLAEIDIGKGDTDYRYALHQYKKSKTEYDYAHKFFVRQEHLYQSKQLSQDIYERYKRDLNVAYECMKSYEALQDKTKRELDNAKIKAPADGTIIAINISPGAAVLNDFQNILFEIAHDINSLEARLDIDESDIGHIKLDQSVALSVNSFPYKLFRGKVNSVSMTPKRINQGKDSKEDDQQSFYKAIIFINNKDNYLKPGMTAHAQIAIDKRKKVKTINGIAFQIGSEQIKTIAKNNNLSYSPLDKQSKKKLRRNSSGTKQFVWIHTDQGFEERTVTVGMTDNSYWEVIDGVNEQDIIIIDIDERSSSMQSMSWKLPL